MSKKAKKARKQNATQNVQEKQKMQVKQKAAQEAKEKQETQVKQKAAQEVQEKQEMQKGKETPKKQEEQKQKQKNWNQGGKKRRQKLSQEEERLGYLLDQAEEEELLKISGIHSKVSMPLPNREKLAWSVIDKADLADEEELKRREEFQRMLRRKKMARIAIGCSAAVVLLLVLAGLGVFDYFRPPAYEEYYVLGGNCCSAEDSIDPMKVFRKKALPDGVDVSLPSLAVSPQLDMDRLDTTAYDALAEYCEANDYAVHEYKIVDYVSGSDEFLDLGEGTNPEYRLIDDKLYVRCTVIGTCLDYGMRDDGTPWGELTENGEWGWEHPATSFEFTASERSDIGEVIPILTSPLSLDDPENTCYVCLTLYVCIEEMQTAGEDGLVTMSATLTEDNSTTLVCTIVNETEKDIEIGEEYRLQVLKDDAFVDVPLSPEIGFNLLSRDILSGNEYSYRVDIEHNHGDLEAGRYRIVKEYMNKGEDSQKGENASKETVSAEFDLP